MWRAIKPETANTVSYQFSKKKNNPDLFTILFRCKTTSDSQYCEFIDKTKVIQKFTPPNPNDIGKCLLITTGTHAKQKYKRFVVCQKFEKLKEEK